MYNRTRGSTFALQMKFGITHSPLSLWLRYGMAILVAILRKDKWAAICIPTDEEINTYQKMIENRHTILRGRGIAFTADGLKLYLQ